MANLIEAWLEAQGARKVDGEWLGAKEGDDAGLCAPLAHFALYRIDGEDAEAFLQGQLSNDVRQLDGARAQYTTYSNAKGRMLANMLLWRDGDGFFMLLAADLAEQVVRRLRMFVLRSRVNFQAADTLPLLLDEPGAERLLAGLDLAMPANAMQQTGAAGVTAIRLPHAGVLVVARDGDDSRLSSALENSKIGVAGRNWADGRFVASGFAWVVQATQEAFVPQMANMELLDAVNFRKGCYPGQEIVARMQYLGKTKRRLFRVYSAAPLAPGMPLQGAESPETEIGQVAYAAELPDQGCEALVVVMVSAWEKGIICPSVDSVLTRLQLPYEIPDLDN
ncbi:YgfZ/GcvT domain-containing protein [Crenobacter caeni]|uniref:Folate-binding protein YgfZ n=1 Tax=Crenobacter caeni TaxID=2705474 RepID=A0A6B2KP44_9NEIS|nr:folate-binding protein YgfZ [Crenobacter caeni]NDV11903.1 folate-binding protein YgfZ [Crenobacter caeni]